MGFGNDSLWVLISLCVTTPLGFLPILTPYSQPEGRPLGLRQKQTLPNGGGAFGKNMKESASSQCGADGTQVGDVVLSIRLQEPKEERLEEVAMGRLSF